MPIGGVGGPKIPTRPSDGFQPPRCDLSIPDNLGHPPTLADVTVKQGFDGKTPDQAAQLVLKGSKSKVAPQNTSFVLQTAKDVHKAFTIAVNNAFIAGSPVAKLLAQHPGATLTILGTMSEVHPTLVQLNVPGQRPQLFQPGPGGTYAPLAKSPYQVVMQADVRLGTTPGVRISYPAWSVPALSGQLSTVTELGTQK